MWVAEMAEQRYWDRIYWIGEKVPVNQDLVENRKEKMDKERNVSCVYYMFCVSYDLVLCSLCAFFIVG